jgi:hypothetical protein
MKVVYIGDHPSKKTTFTHGGNSVTFEKDKPKEVPDWLPNRFKGHSDFKIVEDDKPKTEPKT